jgi:hypothetical protein
MNAENEKEWRSHMLEEIKEIKKIQIEMRISVSNLQLKVAFFGILFGTIGAFLKDNLTF